MSSGPIGAESGGASGRQPAFEPAGTWDLPSGSMLRVMGHDVSPLGLAHVDLMDLHVVREDGVPMTRDVLPSAVIDDRYSKAAGSGASWNRWSFYWDMIERRPNELTWEPVDAIVARDRGKRTPDARDTARRSIVPSRRRIRASVERHRIESARRGIRPLWWGCSGSVRSAASARTCSSDLLGRCRRRY